HPRDRRPRAQGQPRAARARARGRDPLALQRPRSRPRAHPAPPAHLPLITEISAASRNWTAIAAPRVIARMRSATCACVVLAALAASLGCNRGYVSAEVLESSEIGPRHCDRTCSDFGMEMGAFVLIQHSYAGCVC